MRRIFFGILAVGLTAWGCFALGLYGGAVEHTKPHLRIGATYMTMNNPFYSIIDEELRLMIESRGDILLTRDPALSQEKQNAQIHELLSSGIDLLVLNPVDFWKIKPALEEAQRAGVPVVVVDSQVGTPSLVACTIASDNYGAGRLCAEYLMKVRDHAQIVVLEHANSKSGKDRIEGFCDALTGYDTYQIVGRAESNGQLELAMPETKRLIAECGSFDVVMALNDPTALGAMAALEESNLLSQTIVFGVDGAPEAKNMVEKGSLTGTVAQSPIQIGQITAQVVYKILSGEDYPQEITVPVELITAENIQNFDLDGWQ